MSPERFEQVSTLFHAAIELDSRELTDFLDQACSGDDELRREVELLLAFDKRPTEFLDMQDRPHDALAKGSPDRANENRRKFCPKCGEQYPRSARFCPSDNQLLSLQDPYHLIGLTLAEKYQIEALVGIGGMGAVYSARHVGIDRHVAFKILQPNVALGNQRMISLFEQEAKIVGQLYHDNIAGITDAGQTADGLAFIVMEWLDGRTLDEEIAASGRLSLEHTTDIIRQIAAALETAHAKNIVHRDLKPSNIMLVENPKGHSQVKVLDFGIAKVISATGGSPVSAPVGTPHYASPEQLQDGDFINRCSDIYSLGIILYQMLTGSLPFDDPSVRKVILMQLMATPPSIREIRPDLPASVDQLVSQMLSKDPAQRPQHAGEVAVSLEKALQSCDEIKKVDAQADIAPTNSNNEMDAISGNQSSGKLLQLFSRYWRYAVFFVALVVVLYLWINNPFGNPEKDPPTPTTVNISLPGLTEDLGYGVTLEMVQLPKGEYDMGSNIEVGEPDETPKHKESVNAFAIGKYEITQAQWKAIMGSDNNPSRFTSDDNLPVDNVSWEMAQGFIKQLQQKTGNQNYRLPAESEWEYAARAGSSGKWSFGDDESKLPDYAWYAGTALSVTHPVGTKMPNAWGIFDMQGNVMEWCQDRYYVDAYGRKVKNDMQQPLLSTHHVLRGGCLVCTADNCRVAYRDYKMATHIEKCVGFRVARSL